MYKEQLFHGSKRSRGEAIIDSGEMISSRGKHHWLGDGSYFFSEDFYSYKWICDMYKKRHSDRPITYSRLLEHYLILKVNVCTSRERVFDLTRAEHKIIFDRMYKSLKENQKIQGEFAEGVVINYMFNHLEFEEDFDLVRAVFKLNERKYEFVKSRINFMPQEQICIKKQTVVNDIEEYGFEDRLDTFEMLARDMYFDNIQVDQVKEDEVQKYHFTYRKNSNGYK